MAAMLADPPRFSFGWTVIILGSCRHYPATTRHHRPGPVRPHSLRRSSRLDTTPADPVSGPVRVKFGAQVDARPVHDSARPARTPTAWSCTRRRSRPTSRYTRPRPRSTLHPASGAPTSTSAASGKPSTSRPTGSTGLNPTARAGGSLRAVPRPGSAATSSPNPAAPGVRQTEHCCRSMTTRSGVRLRTGASRSISISRGRVPRFGARGDDGGLPRCAQFAPLDAFSPDGACIVS